MNEGHPIWQRLFDRFCQGPRLHFLDKLSDADESDPELAFQQWWATFQGFEVFPEYIDVVGACEALKDYELGDYFHDIGTEVPSLVKVDRFMLDFSAESIRDVARPGIAWADDLFAPHAEADEYLERRRLLHWLADGQRLGVLPNLERVAREMTQVLRSHLRKLVYLGPTRDYPERLRLFSESPTTDVGASGQHMGEALFSRPHLVGLVDAQLREFGVPYRLDVRRLDGFGEEGGAAYALRLVDTRNGAKLSLRDVGFGLSQVLPVIVQSVMAKDQVILIEQPELHLHPRLQAALGTLFGDAIGEGRGNQFIVETHSEHLVLRLQRHVRRGRVRPEDVAILFVEPDPTGEATGAWVRHLRLDDEGDFIDDWPGSFFEESFEEVFGL